VYRSNFFKSVYYALFFESDALVEAPIYCSLCQRLGWLNKVVGQGLQIEREYYNARRGVGTS